MSDLYYDIEDNGEDGSDIVTVSKELIEHEELNRTLQAYAEAMQHDWEDHDFPIEVKDLLDEWYFDHLLNLVYQAKSDKRNVQRQKRFARGVLDSNGRGRKLECCDQVGEWVHKTVSAAIYEILTEKIGVEFKPPKCVFKHRSLVEDALMYFHENEYFNKVFESDWEDYGYQFEKM